jgi:hypothetical protein
MTAVKKLGSPSPATTAAKDPKDNVFSSSETANENPRILIYGPPGHGKTFFACSLSAFWPQGPLTRSEKRIELTDICYVGFDDNALSGLLQFNITCPYLIDVPRLMGKRRQGEERAHASSIHDAIKVIVNGVNHAVYTKGCKAVVFDTISTFDKALVSYWGDIEGNDNAPKTGGDKLDSRGVYRCVLTSHQLFHQAIRKLPVPILFLCHAKSIKEEVQPNQTSVAKKKATFTPGAMNAEVIPSITGQGFGSYVDNCDIVGPIKTVTEPGGKQIRKFLPGGDSQFLGKNRFQETLKNEEIADMRAILKKIQSI